MNIKKYLICLLYIVGISSVCTQTAVASFQVVDNFESLTNGAVNGQNGWAAESSTIDVVSTSFGGVTTKALENGSSSTGASVALPTSLTTGSTGTLYFEFKTSSLTAGQSFGLSDTTTLTDFDDYGPQMALNGSGNFVAAGGTSGNHQFDQSASIATGTVYKIWMVVDNNTQTWSGYIQGGAFTSQTQLTSSSGTVTSFAFRTGGSSGTMSAFLFRHGGGTDNALEIDNVYFDAAGSNLISPAGGFDLVDNFESLSVGAVNGQGGWSAESSTIDVVSVSFGGSTSKALENGSASTGASVALPNSLPSGSTGTLYFEFQTGSLTVGQSFGLSDTTTLNDFNDYGPQIALNNGGDFMAAGGSSPSVEIDQGSSLAVDTVYKLWMVVDNDNETWSGYIQGGAFSSQTQLTSGSGTNSTFNFRNGGATGTMSAFLFRHGSGADNALEVDNIYFDASGTNLSSPASTTSPISGPPMPGNWSMVFEDNFDDPDGKLDGTKWKVGSHVTAIGGSGGVSPDAISIEDGLLKFTVDQVSTQYGNTTYSFSTGEITTYKKYKRKFGYYEARIRYDMDVSGLWPAFWLMPDNGDYGYENGTTRSILKFDLSNESIGTVTSATLKLRINSIEGTPNSLLVMGIENDDWEEDQVTWNNAPVEDPIWINHLWNVNQSVDTDLSIDLTDYVQAEVSGDGKVSILLADTFMLGKNIRFYSNNYATQAYRPRLVVNSTTYYADEDARLAWGTNADTNFGDGDYLPVEESYGPAVATDDGLGMEIDIMESFSSWGSNINQHVAHWNGYPSTNKTWGPIIYPASVDDFHTYGLYWAQDHLEFFIDGVKTGEWDNSRILDTDAFMLLTFQVGGPGNSSGSYDDGKTMEVDWVRVWEGTKSSNYPAGSSLYVEAEDKDNTTGFSPLIVSTNAGASNGEFIQVTPGTSQAGTSMPNPGYADYEFDVSEDMTVDIWVRARAANDGSSVPNNDSFILDLLGDEKSSKVWNGAIQSTSWEWYRIYTQILTAGTYTLRVGYREDGTQLDQIYITGAWDNP